MSIAIYNPRSKVFESLSTNGQVNLPFGEMLLLNILIELKVHTQLLTDANPAYPRDTPEQMRADVTSNL